MFVNVLCAFLAPTVAGKGPEIRGASVHIARNGTKPKSPGSAPSALNR